LEPNILYKRFVGLKPEENIPLAVLAEKKINWKKKIANWVRLNCFIPDAKIGWYPYAVKAAKKIIEQEKPSIIISSSPPPTVHLIARKLAKWSGLKWVADFRDPWTDIFYYQNNSRLALADKLDKRLEKHVLNEADKVFSVSPAYVRQLKEKSGGEKFQVLYNGYDAADLQWNNVNAQKKNFKIAFVGNLKASHNCELLWKVLQKMIQEDEDFKNHLKLEFIGIMHPIVQSSLEQFNLMPHVESKGFQPHQEAIKEMKRASVLLFLIPDAPNNRGILTGKIFEYLACAQPILAIGPPDGDAAKLLSETAAGKMLSPKDQDGIRKRIQNLFELWKKELLAREAPDSAKVSRFERKEQLGILAREMDNLLADT